MKNAILTVLNIKKGEEKPIFFLLIYSFFMGAAMAFFFTSATSMFLVDFDSSYLPLAYIGGGIMSYLIWIGYSKIAKRVKFQTLLFVGTAILLVSVAFFAIGVNFFNNQWLSFLMFVWIRVLIFISVVGFWGLANKMFDIRQGKRLFGLISSGEVISDMVGFFSIPLLLKYITTPNLLFVSFLLLVVCFFLLIIIVKRFSSRLQLDDKTITPKTLSNKSSLKNNKYSVLLVGMAILPMFGMCFADYSFLSQTRIVFDNQTVLASFLSLFFGATAVVEFIVKSFLSGRLLYKYGLKVALLVLPIILFISVFLVVGSGLLFGVTGVFFAFIAFVKLIDRVLRSAIYDPSFQVLYQPIPANERITAQAVIEGMAKGLGFAAAGLFVLIFAHVDFINTVYVNVIFLVILLVWISLTFKMYREYRISLKTVLLQNKESDILHADDKSNLTALCKIVEINEKDNFHIVFNFLNKIDPRLMPDFLQRLLSVYSVKNQKDVLIKVLRYKVISLQTVIRKGLKSKDDIFNDKIKETQNELQKYKNIPFSTLEKYTSSSNVDERLLAANLLAYSGRHNAADLLLQLLQDSNCDVKKAAIMSAGRCKRQRLWNRLLHCLYEKDCDRTAMSAIKMIGEPMLGLLDEYFEKQMTSVLVKHKIIDIFSSIKGAKSVRLLRSKIQYPDEAIRHHIYKVLSIQQYSATSSEVAVIKSAIFYELEIMVWLMASEFDLKEQSELDILREVIIQEQQKKKENLFLLLSMLYDSKVINFIRESFDSGEPQVRMYAAELLDITVPHEIKDIYLPFIDNTSVEEKLTIFLPQFPQEKMNVVDRLINIINQSNTKVNAWLKACALKVVSQYDDSENILLANMNNQNLIINQLSNNALHDLKSERFNYLRYKQLTLLPQITNSGIRLFETVKIVLNHQLFVHVPYANIAAMVESSELITVSEQEPYEIRDALIFILQGEGSICVNGTCLKTLNVNDLYWGIIHDEEDKVVLQAQNTIKAYILDADILFDLMTEKCEFTEEVVHIMNKVA